MNDDQTSIKKIGSCQFLELPQQYQDLFESNHLNGSMTQFFPYKPSFSAVPKAIFLSLAYILPALIVVFGAPYAVYQDPTLVSRIINDLTSGVIQFLVIAAIFSLIISVTYFMLDMGIRALGDWAVWARTRRAAETETYHYGLLLDEDNLVLRSGNHFEDYNSAFIPKGMIKTCFVSQIRVEGSKQNFNINVVKLRYVDEQKERKELALKEQFSMSAAEMCDIIQQWLITNK
ncbi:MAG: hypothetical protein AAF485_14265 [Chloroflexota bacterium]